MNTKLVIAKYAVTHDIAIVRCVVPEEHPDNDRFARDCEPWFGLPVLSVSSDEYSDCEEVWRRTRYMSGVHGARCTVEMKKAVRFAFEQSWQPDLQAFGYTADEKKRVDRFRQQNPEVQLVSMLVEHGLSKDDCHAIVARAGIELPIMYRLGFENANCRGCVNAQSPRYWNRTRRHFPDVFAARAGLSRELGVRLVKLTTGARERIYLDDLDANDHSEDPSFRQPDCSLLCRIAETEISENEAAG